MYGTHVRIWINWEPTTPFHPRPVDVPPAKKKNLHSPCVWDEMCLCTLHLCGQECCEWSLIPFPLAFSAHPFTHPSTLPHLHTACDPSWGVEGRETERKKGEGEPQRENEAMNEANANKRNELTPRPLPALSCQPVPQGLLGRQASTSFGHILGLVYSSRTNLGKTRIHIYASLHLAHAWKKSSASDLLPLLCFLSSFDPKRINNHCESPYLHTRTTHLLALSPTHLLTPTSRSLIFSTNHSHYTVTCI